MGATASLDFWGKPKMNPSILRTLLKLLTDLERLEDLHPSISILHPSFSIYNGVPALLNLPSRWNFLHQTLNNNKRETLTQHTIVCSGVILFVLCCPNITYALEYPFFSKVKTFVSENYIITVAVQMIWNKVFYIC